MSMPLLPGLMGNRMPPAAPKQPEGGDEKKPDPNDPAAKARELGQMMMQAEQMVNECQSYKEDCDRIKEKIPDAAKEADKCAECCQDAVDMLEEMAKADSPDKARGTLEDIESKTAECRECFEACMAFVPDVSDENKAKLRGDDAPEDAMPDSDAQGSAGLSMADAMRRMAGR